MKTNSRAVALLSIFLLLLGLFWGPGAYADNAGNMVISPSTLENATKDYQYNQFLNVTGGSGPYTWSVVYNSLPSGLSLDSVNGIISGTPEQAGNYSFSVSVTDSVYQCAYQSYNLLVNPIPVLDLPSVDAGYQYTFPYNVNTNGMAIWSVGDNLSLKLYRIDSSDNQTVQRTLIKEYTKNNSWLNIYDDYNLNFPLPAGLSPAPYELEIFNGSNLIAKGNFSIMLKYLNINPQQIFSGYNADTRITLNADYSNSLWYNRESDLSIKIYRVNHPNEANKYRQFIKGMNVPSNSVSGSAITVGLPPGLQPGYYELDLLKANRHFAMSNFAINVRYVNIDPPTISSNYSADQNFTLSEEYGTDVWSTTDTLSLEIWVTEQSGITSPRATVPSSALTVTDNTLRFKVPAGLTDGAYEIRVLRTKSSGQEFIANTGFGVFPPAVKLDINYDRLEEGYEGTRTASFIKPANTTLWTTGDNLHIQLFKHIQNTQWAPGNFTEVIEDMGTVNIDADGKAVFTIPAGLSAGEYMVKLFKDTIPVGYAVIRVDRQLLAMAVGLSQLYLGYDNRMTTALFMPGQDMSSMLWLSQGDLWARVCRYDVNNDQSVDLGAVNIASGPSVFDHQLSIPANLPIGTYKYIIGNKSGPLAYADFSVLPFPLYAGDLEADNVKPMQLLLNNWSPSCPWKIGDQLRYTLSKLNNENNQYYETAINGPVSIMSNSALSVMLPAMMNAGHYAISILSASNEEIASAEFNVNSANPVISIRNVRAYRTASGVVVPVYGHRLSSAAAAQFALSFDPKCVQVDENYIINTPLTNAKIGSHSIENINPDLSKLLVTVLANPNSTLNYDDGVLCNVAFNVYSPYNSDIFLSLNDSYNYNMLSDPGGNIIPAGFSDGSINLAIVRGDLNGNNQVDVGDAVVLLRHLANLAPLDSNMVSLADVDDNQVVDVADMIQLLKRVVNEIRFPEEVPLY